MADLAEHLQARGLRITRSRRAIIECLPASGSFRAEAVLSAARRRAPSVGRATVFRLLALLAREGIVERLPGPDGVTAYRLSDGPAGHHHLLTCTGCGRGVAVADPRLESLLLGLTAAHGFRPEGHALAMFGRCPDCDGGTTSGEGRVQRGRSR